MVTGSEVSERVRNSIDPESGQYNMAEEIQRALDEQIEACADVISRQLRALLPHRGEEYAEARFQLAEARKLVRALKSDYGGRERRGRGDARRRRGDP